MRYSDVLRLVSTCSTPYADELRGKQTIEEQKTNRAISALRAHAYAPTRGVDPDLKCLLRAKVRPRTAKKWAARLLRALPRARRITGPALRSPHFVVLSELTYTSQELSKFYKELQALIDSCHWYIDKDLGLTAAQWIVPLLGGRNPFKVLGELTIDTPEAIQTLRTARAYAWGLVARANYRPLRLAVEYFNRHTPKEDPYRFCKKVLAIPCPSEA
jgi:hypothetical protein